jgi:uncharacterized protein YxeA
MESTDSSLGTAALMGIILAGVVAVAVVIIAAVLITRRRSASNSANESNVEMADQACISPTSTATKSASV